MQFFYTCTECSKEYKITKSLMVCPHCSKEQKVNEPLRGVLEVSFKGKPKKNFEVFDFLPVERKYFPKIPVGNTPLWEPTNIRDKYKFKNLYVKDDTSNPTSSFKDRASYLVAAFAKKFKINNIVVASTGNAASSMAGVGAAAGINVTIFVPKTAPKAKMIQVLQYGAKLIIVDGNYDRAFDLSLEYFNKVGGLSRNTAYNPMTIEGKKTVSLEIFKDLKNKAPDYVFVPTGDGVILAGVFKGFKDLLKCSFIKRMPKIISVQSEGSPGIYNAFHDGKFEKVNSNTVADSISVDVPRNGYHAVSLLKKYKGDVIKVSDEEILLAQKEMSELAGLFTEPAAATAYAGFIKHNNTIPKNATVVILATGNGLKDIDSATRSVKMPEKYISSIDEI